MKSKHLNNLMRQRASTLSTERHVDVVASVPSGILCRSTLKWEGKIPNEHSYIQRFGMLYNQEIKELWRKIAKWQVVGNEVEFLNFEDKILVILDLA